MSHKYPDQCGSTNTINNRDRMRASYVSEYADKHLAREQAEEMAQKREDFKQRDPDGYEKKMKRNEEAKAAAESAKTANEASASADTSSTKNKSGKSSAPESSSSFVNDDTVILAVVAIFTIFSILYKVHKNQQARKK